MVTEAEFKLRHTWSPNPQTSFLERDVTKGGSRKDPSATPGMTSKLGPPTAGVALFMDSLPE